MNALWIYLNSSACSPGHKAIPTDALSHPKWVIEMLFFSCPASLVEFTLSGEIGEVMEDMDMDPKQSDWDLDQGLLALRQEPLYHLKAIELPRVDIEVASLAPLFCSILEQCPAVEKLTLPFLRDLKAMHAISKTVGDCCPSISDLVVPSSWHNKNDEALMAVTGGIQVQRLERIRIGWFLDQPSSNLSAAVFARHSDTLRQIEFFNCRRIFSNTIQVILVTCRALEILKVQKSSIENSRRNCLMLEAAVLKEWVCTRIRNLAIIVEFAPDGRGPKYLNDPTKATWTEEDHHHYRMLDKFYTQIGSLTQLEVLTMQASGFNTLHCKRSHGKIPFRETCLPGLLALEDEVTGQIGFLSRWAGLRKLRDLRGSFSVTTKEAVARMGGGGRTMMSQTLYTRFNNADLGSIS
ncbi:hypothetical protein BGW39_010321 [Mortierella sp. 14UC]|nr:hypothetical protein BGW39_010321 [Mortierella sp. 14UC]